MDKYESGAGQLKCLFNDFPWVNRNVVNSAAALLFIGN